MFRKKEKIAELIKVPLFKETKKWNEIVYES